MKIIRDDNFFMNLAINIAKRNRGMTGVNPSVGCVVVSKSKTIISTGSTGTNGSPHAEKVALDGINIEAGSTLYTTLEPCFHSGKNPPCVNEIIKAESKELLLLL